MKHIIFSNHALSGAGGARVILNLSELLIKKNYKVSILIDRNIPIAFDIPDNVGVYLWHPLGIKKIYSNEKIKSTLDHKINKKKSLTPSLKNKLAPYIKWMYYFFLTPLFIISLYRFSKKNRIDYFIQNNIYVGLERNILVSKLFKFKFKFNFHNSPIEVFSRNDFKLLIKPQHFFKKFDCIAVSRGIIEELQSIIKKPSKELICIYNPFNFDKIRSLALEEIPNITNTPPYFIAVSTLTPRKRIDRLIKSYHAYYNKSNSTRYHLFIAGTGELELELKAMVERLNITSHVHFIGFINNIYPYIKRSKGLLLTSDSEGLPTVLIESLILETPVISTNCLTGPSEILIYNTTFLVDINTTETIIENQISDLMVQLQLTSSYIYDVTKFNENTVLNEWTKILN
ncbi:glycosyltransferase [Providencia sp. PROV019]|uniref:glycosyltransferase n=1 Tax=Providencia sp. PROV019 TaxID=2949754 RepID=UPI00234A75A5|nr:glycosyltransferase [Providencia sp. PROV019]